MFRNLDLSPIGTEISMFRGQTLSRVGGDAGLSPAPFPPAEDDKRPGSDAEDWTPREPVAPPSDTALAVTALIPIWAGIAWIIYTLIR
jgi:hypothetical protein